MNALALPTTSAVVFYPANAGRKWTNWLGPLISLALLAGVLREYSRFELRADSHVLEAGAGFGVLFVLHYLVTPVCEWLIYRRLWRLPSAGIAALLRKEITNDLLLGYLGEIYFYAWARQRAKLSASPFGAIKDVAILSAVVGNVLTLALLPLAVALVGNLPPGIDPLALKLSVAAFLLSSFAPLVFRRRLLSLPSGELWFIARIQVVRVAVGIALYAALWHLLLPGVVIGWWIALAGLRQLVARLPFAPSRDVLFAAIAGFFVGRHSEIAALLALFGAMTMLLHLVLGAVLSTTGMLESPE
ncbi:hypothetical protein [Novosphingobium sp. Gsoil 351]|uniref:hypothetical protein n=1 Tax=Novosphingobium sp. Gsoil 351 TaxID=2675225 RepID=UPI0012B498E0|nr:hypothetical protein [Novosphingobium sp. Gsoil 351]QGN55814.1 hypothetical protein GKE62_15925 [Novosphingobium sp. Gsoil 351]